MQGSCSGPTRQPYIELAMYNEECHQSIRIDKQ